MILALLFGCTGEPAAVCTEMDPDPWDPEWEDDVRVDESTAIWDSVGPGAVDPDATTCPAPPCLALIGPVEARVPLSVNRGQLYRITGTLTSDVSVRVSARFTGADSPTHVVAEELYPAGTSTIDLSFTISQAQGDTEVSVEVAEEGAATLDDFAVVGQRWAASDATAVGVVQLGFLIHVEDDGKMLGNAEHWGLNAAVLSGLSEVLHQHGAGLGIQADATFVRAAAMWEPEWVPDRVSEGAGWSVHIHDESDPDAVEPAIRDARVALREVGIDVIDLNGGFATAPWARAAAAGLSSLTAYKDPATQAGLPHVQLQPWRPADGVGSADPDAFLEHDPDGPLVYLPGYDIREADHARFPEASANVLSQVLAHAREGHVNTWYFVLHIDGFGPAGTDDEAQAAYLADGFPADLAAYDTFLTDTVDPLVAAGHVAYATPQAMYETWEQWDIACAADAEAAR